MLKRKIIFFCALLTLVSFSGQLVLAINPTSPVTIELDLDKDLEKEDLQEELRETSLFLTSLSNAACQDRQHSTSLISDHLHLYTRPILEIQSPPPKAS